MIGFPPRIFKTKENLWKAKIICANAKPAQPQGRLSNKDSSVQVNLPEKLDIFGSYA